VERDEWSDLARKVDWTLSYVDERAAFPIEMSGSPWLPGNAWRDWDEPYRTTFAEYVATQHEKELALAAVRQALGSIDDFKKLPPTWLDALKLGSRCVVATPASHRRATADHL
jgi:toluene monooxygenase system protein A